MADAKYEVWIIRHGQTEYEYRLLGRTDNREGAKTYCEERVMAGVFAAAKVVETATGRILAEWES